MLKKICLLLAAVCLLAPVLSGCGGNSKTIRYDIPETVENLDPQFATSSTARMVIGNIYEGLVVQDSDGEIAPGAAESYTVSADGLRYTFTLREGVCWSDGKALTSADFAFAFRRLFSTGSPSPFASDYLCIAQASQVLQQLQPVSALGIATPDARTIVFTLEHESPFFLELLAATPAMPCNETFFDEAKGRYGLERKYICSNGPFLLHRWDNSKYLLLLKSENYVSDKPVLAEGVNLYIGRSDPLEEFLDGNADLLVASHEDLPRIPGSATITSFDKTTWCLVFNQNDPVLGNAVMRQSFAHALDEQSLGGYLPAGLTTTRTFVPPAMLLLEQSYRDIAGYEPLLDFDTERAAYLFKLGLDSLELSTLPAITLSVPSSDSHAASMAYVQQYWQKYLGAFVDIEILSPGEIQQRFANGRYQILLMPFSPSSGHIRSLLGAFTSASSQNYTGYRNPRFDAILQDAADEESIEETAAKYHQAEALLLTDAVVVPVYFETTTYAVSKGVQGVDISPFSGRIYFKYAQK